MRVMPAMLLSFVVEFIVAVMVGSWAMSIPFGVVVFLTLTNLLPPPKGARDDEYFG